MLTGMDAIDASVVKEAVAGDRVALERILRALERPFFHLALRMLLTPADAEDATQECLIRVVTRLAQFRGESRFSTWAWRVAVSRILDLRDQQARAPAISFDRFAADLADGLDPRATERPDDLVLLGELKMACGRALLQCLDPDHRLAFIVGEILGVEGPQAAEILEVEPATFRKRLSRARERLQAALSGNCGVVNPDAPCRCHRRLVRATTLARVTPGSTTTDVPLDVARLRRQVHGIREARRATAYFRADPTSRPRRDLVRACLAPLRE